MKNSIPAGWRYRARQLLTNLGVSKYRDSVGCHPTLRSRRLLDEVLYSGNWNIEYSANGMHTRLEKAMADYVGVEHAIAVSSGGVALQMIFRALGLGHGDEVVHQVDTCVATPFAVLNSCVTPIFSDISKDDLLLDMNALGNLVSPSTKAILPIHLWGRPEDMDAVTAFANQHGLTVIEDACLALGAISGGRKVGSIGKAAAFSFGTLKPVQAGEGAVITTNDGDLARELRILRSWGDTSSVGQPRDNRQLAWNGRPSEFVCAVALSQLEQYDERISRIRECMQYLEKKLKQIGGCRLIAPQGIAANVFTQVSMEIPETVDKQLLMNGLTASGYAVRHANFEPVTTTHFFREGVWKDWILKGDLRRVEENYTASFPRSETAFKSAALGIDPVTFRSVGDVRSFVEALKKNLDAC